MNYLMYGRPSAKEQILLKKRKQIIINLWNTQEYTQSELAFIFRLPRNTVHVIVKELN